MVILSNLTFSLDERTVHYTKYVSPYGCYGLPWEPFNPADDFGKIGRLVIDAGCHSKGNAPSPLRMAFLAVILKEKTIHSSFMMLKFLLEKDEKEAFELYFHRYGQSGRMGRQFPRIPIVQFSKHVLVDASVSFLRPAFRQHAVPEIFHLENISPNGVLLSSHGVRAISFVPGQAVKVVLSQVGENDIVSIEFEGLICRTFDEVASQSWEIQHFVGIKITHINSKNKKVFFALLKDILLRIKKDYLNKTTYEYRSRRARKV